MKKPFRAVWVSTVCNIDFPTHPGLSPAQMRAETDAIIARAKEIGLNAVILQVRPTTDALYKSALFPWSHWLTGRQGTAPEDFDPLAYWITRCREADLEIHAWVNPYRVAHKMQGITCLSELAPGNPARTHPEWVSRYEGSEAGYRGAWYFDPGIPEVRRLIIDGAAELTNNYDIDGFHIDDYFYPNPDFDDEKTYKRYANGAEKAAWRRECVNALIRGLHDTAKKAGVRFGVSPSGVWLNKTSDSRGSDTRGHEHHNAMYADSYTWIKEGWLDYIVPQIYWQIGHQSADYATLVPWWANVCESTAVDLYIGMAAYRESNPEKPEWAGEMPRQLAFNAAHEGLAGEVFFTYNSLKGPVGDAVRDWYQR